MKWFRMHTSLVDSIKVGTLSNGAFRAYVELQCLAGERDDGGRTGVTAASVNWRLRRDVSCDVTEIVTAGLVTVDGDGEYVIERWDEKQFKSDSSAGRTREYRDRKRAKSLKDDGVTDGDVTGDGGDGHGDGTRAEQKQNRTDQKEPARKRSASAVQLDTYLADLKAKGETFLPEDDQIFKYAETVGLSDDMLRVAFLKFKARYKGDKKRYIDWRRVFRRSVEERWMKLWYLDQGTGKVHFTNDGLIALEQFKSDAVLRRAA